jgi:hypothetical protein
MRRLAVVGAGPTGLAAALGALARGFEVTVFEAETPGAALRRWGNARFFTPLGMNVPACFRGTLGAAMPADDALLTGPQFAAQVLGPLAACPVLKGRVRNGHRVVSIGRKGLTRADLPGHPLRAERPFRLLVHGPEGEFWVEADHVLDAGGASALPTFLGEGGLPAPGERDATPRLVRSLGDFAARLGALANRRLLLLGHGHSAANALLELEELAGRAPDTRVVWAVRSAHAKPCVEVASDPLPERRRVVGRANDLAQRPPAWLRVERRAAVQRLDQISESLTVTLSGGRALGVDALIGLTGYRPDLSFLSELPVAIAPTTEGGLQLTHALANVTDCLSVPRLSPRDLGSGEPGFYMVGAKSYGRARTFLLQSGYAQLESVLDALASV